MRSFTVRIGIDTGGTFTDFVVAHGSRITAFKVPSTPQNPAESILEGVRRALDLMTRGESTAITPDIVHGTTVATNALLERKGARTALITTEGFQDVIEIGRQARPEIYNLMVTRPGPLVPAELRFGVRERIGPDGTIVTSLDADSVKRAAALIETQKPESIAVCLLFSFANPMHERMVAEAVKKSGLPLSLSHVILPEYREYERTSTTVINAYLAPLMSRYLQSLGEGLDSVIAEATGLAGKSRGPVSRKKKQSHLRVMQSNGGSVSAETAAVEPVRAILSGPAGGVVGAMRVCAAIGIGDIITFDMGGTSTDVALCRGEMRTTNEAIVAGLPVAVPVIDIHTVGAGGGSIARVDEGGALRVGPQSAGADPGPVCYGRGEDITVTDANLVLGRFGGRGLLGGQMQLDSDRARRYLSRIADRMSQFLGKRVTVETAALGIIRVANANMEQALRVVSIGRGQDPSFFSLITFGGAGGLHVCELASALRIPRVIVPRSPGTLSALGVLLGDVVKDYSRTVMLKTAELHLNRIEREFADLERQARRDLSAEGFAKDRMRVSRSVAMRYVGQSFEIDIPWQAKRFELSFHAAHRERYGYSDPARPTEIVSVRVRAAGITEKPKLSRSGRKARKAPAPSDAARVYFSERAVKSPVYERDSLLPGSRFSGPAVITEYSSTTLVPQKRRVTVDEWLNLIIE